MQILQGDWQVWANGVDARVRRHDDLLCALGGWKDAKTILTCYQAPDATTMRRALLERQPLEMTSANCHTIATPGGFRRASRLGLRP